MSLPAKIRILLTILCIWILTIPPFGLARTPDREESEAQEGKAGNETQKIIKTERGIMVFDTLPGGTRLLVMEIPSSPVVYGMIAVKVGGRYETEQNAGISHLLEHLMFREADGSKSLRAIRETGGSVNAITDMELTTYYFTVLPPHFDQSMSALTALVTTPRFTAEDMEREREIVLEELAQGRNDPRALVLTQLVKQIFPDSPMNSFVIGTKESIESIAYEDVLDFYDTYYTPANMTVIAAGRLDALSVLEKLKALYRGTEADSVHQREFKVPEPALNRLTKKIPIKQSFFIYGFLTPGKSSEDFFAMEVFDILFASGVHSRLQRRIVTEEGYTEQIYPNWYSYSNTGIWAVFLSVDPDDMDAVRSLVEEEMDALKMGMFSQRELDAAKSALIARVKLNLDRPEDLAWFQLENLAYRNMAMSVSEYVQALEHVGMEDIKRIGRIYCSDDMTVTIEMQPARGAERLFLILKYLTTKTL
jgi:predicted Zn-dependent peptidase